jgi:hypothetical protein
LMPTRLPPLSLRTRCLNRTGSRYHYVLYFADVGIADLGQLLE